MSGHELYGVGFSGFVAKGVRDSFIGVGRSVVMCVAKYTVDGLDVGDDRNFLMFRPSVCGGEYLVLLRVLRIVYLIWRYGSKL